MKLILLEKVDQLGDTGTIVEVKKGFGRNYLLPRRKAILYSEKAFQFVETKKKAEQEKYRKEVEKNKVLADRIASLSFTIKAQAGEDDKLYGSVSAQDIQEALEKEGIRIEKRRIVLEEPIKKLGIYTVVVQLLPEVQASVKVWVVRS